MTLLRYLFRKFFPVFLGAVAFFSMVLSLVELLMNLWKYIQLEIPVMMVMKLMVLYLPKTMWYSIPLGILFASSFTLSNLYANNELVAVFASGVSLFKFTLPMLIFSFIMSFGLFYFENLLVVPTYRDKQALQNKLLNTEKSLNNDRIVIIANEGKIIYKVNEYNDSRKQLYDLILIIRDENKQLDSIVKSPGATWDEESQKWLVNFPIQYKLQDGTLKKMACDRELLERINEPYETFRNNTISIEEVNTKEAREYIEHLKRAGLPFDEELSVYYKKYAFPFIVFIVVFLSVGLTGRTKKNVLLISLASSISAAVLFYVTQMVTMLLAKFGYISAFSGAWFPVILFTILSIVLLRFTRT